MSAQNEVEFYPRPGLSNITAYVAGAAAAEGFDKPLLLASNEVPFPPSKGVQAAIRNASREANRYPDGGSTLLREKIAEKFGLEADRIMAGSGSEELLQIVCRAFARDGDEVLCSQYGFMMYPIIAHSVGATPVMVPERDFHVDVEALIRSVNEKTRIIFITNPTNPAGTYTPSDQMRRLVKAIPRNILIVVDEAYAEFVQNNGYESALKLAKEFPNVVVTRTFSKIYGLGGLRTGWGYASPAVVEAFTKIRLPFNVNRIALAAAHAALDEDSVVEERRDIIGDTRHWVVSELSKLDIFCPPSVTNFILPEFPQEPARSAQAVLTYLKCAGILVRPMNAYGLPSHLRVTIGLKSEMSQFIKKVREIMT
ncbi:MAG: histidinol-phosphate transaminase [Hyphomicrobiales bacterium]|nr:histidinol-phosphate transaminase [Hyphomicrobiales bacterium]